MSADNSAAATTPFADLAEVPGVHEAKPATDGSVIVNQQAFEELCEQALAEGVLTFDTEFVSESFYRPKLCLLQVGTLSRLAAIDPFTLRSPDPLWSLIADPAVIKVVHGGREEVRFALEAGYRPTNLIDVQIAQGLLGRSFPIAYKAVCQRTIGAEISTHETRTDWSRRPLSGNQIRYALEDIEHLLPIALHQQRELAKLDRTAWADEEFDRFVGIVSSEPERDTFRRVSGVTRLRGVELAVAEVLHEYRRDEAIRLNKPLKHVLRDDLLIDISRRRPRSRSELFHTRGMSRKFNNETAEEVVQLVAAAVAKPREDWPVLPRAPKAGPGDETLVKLLSLALSDRCANLDVALSLVGSQADLQDVVRHHAGTGSETPPKLLTGWRREVCGSLLEDLLEGRIALKVKDWRKADPLVFEQVVQSD